MRFGVATFGSEEYISTLDGGPCMKITKQQTEKREQKGKQQNHQKTQQQKTRKVRNQNSGAAHPQERPETRMTD
jgi:hypothetical protein